jgi:hypothetical protein
MLTELGLSQIVDIAVDESAPAVIVRVHLAIMRKTPCCLANTQRDAMVSWVCAEL